MNIEADALRYEDKQQLSTFTGNVVVTKGTIVMRARAWRCARTARATRAA
jgi:lipopolysaccharide transport protein LptA